MSVTRRKSNLNLPKIQTTAAFVPLYAENDPNYSTRFLTFYGGRGGRKSWEVARALLIRGRKKKLKILCAREFQNSIDDSVLALLEETADRIGLSGFYTFQNNKVLGRNGTEFIFKGLGKNIRSIKSTESIDIVWIEEAETTSLKSMRILFPTIRKKGSQIITTFNTGMITDPIYKRLVLDPKNNPKEAKKHYCRLVTYLENPDISSEFVEEAEAMRESDPEGYDHIYLGEPWSRSDAQVLAGKWRIGVMDTTGADGAYLGLDYGFSVDPSVLSKSYIIGKVLYIESEAAEVGVEIDDYESFLLRVEDSKSYRIRADSARPELTSHIKKKGFNIVSCKKWDGCVEDGISLLRSFSEIVINPSCKQAAREAKLWRYKTDRLSGDVLPVLIDANNHAFDAVRYSLEPMVKPSKDLSIRVA